MSTHPPDPMASHVAPLPVSVTPVPVHQALQNTSSQNRPHSPSPSPGLPETTTPSSSGPKTQTVFIHKLYDMLHDPSISHLIWWAPSNDSFCLLPGEDFSKVLSQYFKHTNIASFIRQLNMYGFHKVNDTFQSEKDQTSTASSTSSSASGASGSSTNLPGLSAGSSTTPSNKWEFRHSTNQFRKGDVDSLKLIKRRSSKNINSHKEVVNLKSLPPTSNPIAMDPHQPPYHYGPYSDDESQHAHVRHLSTDSSSYPPPPNGTHQLHNPPQLHQSQQQPSQHPLSSSVPPQVYQQHPQGSTTPIPGSPSSQYPHPHPSEVPAHPSGTPQGPPALIQHYHPHPHPPSTQSASSQPPPPLPRTTSFENSINFKFLDLNTQVNSLKNELAVVSSRYDTVVAELKRNSADTLHILEILESLVSSSDIKQEDIEHPKINTDIFNRENNNKTPVSSAPKEDEQTSPMSGNRKKVSSAHSEISKFKSLLVQRINQPLQVPAATTSAYHLNTAGSKKPSNSHVNIVPQYYPLNPHYTIYNPHNEAYRTAKSSIADEPHSGRNMSVLDPLQPIPNRQNCKILYDEPPPPSTNGTVPNTQNNNLNNNNRIRAESKSYSPLTVGGTKSNFHHLGPLSASSPNNPSSSSSRSSIYDKADIKTYHQYPFPNMNQETDHPQNLPPINRLSNSRTNSLPNPLDHQTDAPTSTGIQRNSFTTIYDHHSFLPALSTTSSGSSHSLAKSASTSGGTIPTISTVRDSPKPKDEENRQLPSVSELDKSIARVSSPVPSKLHSLLHSEEAEKDSGFKKRKI